MPVYSRLSTALSSRVFTSNFYLVDVYGYLRFVLFFTITLCVLSSMFQASLTHKGTWLPFVYKMLARQRILCLTTHIHCVLNKYRGLYTWLSYFLDICWLSYFLGVDWLRYWQVINSLYVR